MAVKLWMPVVVALFAPDLAAAAQDPAPPGKDTKICREAKQKTGSRVRTGPKCRTAEEWRKEDEERSRMPLSATITEGQPDGPTRPRPQ
ncbi:hypothetical protein LZ496_01610 [Sphingomonas sp. NSE70-1]|uniref:Uncharacterized protein n=1 Tax=Sphingomonas caseinilyticus TaxID=2908205 RepID=A0ABT0RRD6_9SPHN|nr:hypothetical protein [Sphingomonas caseinilyticus]MCL6697484.1 hypothetical protein [Sphingomonas caseinilyticus]